jgi:septal ring factor EnvC (AmiA/AmiB activator)
VRLLAALLVLAAPLGAADPAGPQDLKQIKRQMSHARQEKAALSRAEQAQIRLYKRADATVDASLRDWQTHEHNLQIVQEKIAEIERRQQTDQVALAANRAWLSRELRVVQRNGTLGEVRLLLSAKDPAELISRYRFLKTLARNSAARVREMKAGMAKLDEYDRDFKVRKLEFENSKAAAVAARIRAEAEKRKRNALLNGIRQKKVVADSLLRELAQNLESKLAEIQRNAEAEAEAAASARQAQHHGAIEVDTSGPSSFGRHHSLLWPVRGTLLTQFGEHLHPKFRTKVFNRGVEIAAPLGSPVVAVAAGTARFADYFEGYGQMVILDHGGGYFTVYGHNSQLSVQEGSQVRRGDTIAEVGDSSTLGRSSLYFEIRHLAKAVDPMVWLGP